MVIAKNNIAVFGGSGFLGRAIVRQLVAAGMTARVAVRHPETMMAPDTTARGGHALSVYADVADETSVARALDGCDAAVNAVGLYVERRTDTFREVHERGAMHLARQSARAGVKALVHISGIGADLNSQSAMSVPARGANCWPRRLFRAPRSCAPAFYSGQETSS